MHLRAKCQTRGLSASVIGRITTDTTVADRGDTILLTRDASFPAEGFAAVLLQDAEPTNPSVPVAYDFANLEYLADGDVVAIEPGIIRALYRRSSSHNFLLMTEQCNSFCLMCSQPPKRVNDHARINEHRRVIELIDPATQQLGITGGEPTLFGSDFIGLVHAAKEHLPDTMLHVLTNGRSFYYREYARRLAAVGHPHLVLGVPLYAATDTRHDYVVQAAGAFEETVIGLLHLAEYGVGVELRVVLHAQTYRGLPDLAEFIARNFPFVQHIALMGLETIGFTRPNIDTLWIDPVAYQAELRRAVEILSMAGLHVSIYNLQLCVLDRSLWPFAARSISDWKNIYFPVCADCTVREDCGGMFASASWRHSAHIHPITAT